MSAFRRSPDTKNWFRFAMKLGLLATDAAVLSSIARMLTEDRHPMHPRERLSEDLREKGGWSKASALFVGIAIGAAAGMLFAPVSGEEARNAIRDRMMQMRGKARDVGAWAGRGGPSMSQRSTGTYAE